MSKIRIWNGGQKRHEVFVSLEKMPLVLGDVRKALPQLKADLQRQWPVEYVDVENRLPRRKNPFDPSEVVKAACVGLVMGLGTGIGTEITKPLGAELGKYVRRWIKRFTKKAPQKRRRIKPNSQRRKSSRKTTRR
jgi:hypothetical protein